MIERSEENVLLSDSLPVRALVTIAGLRRRGIQARSVDRAAWGTREASLFLIAFDVIGRERVHVLRQRFPDTLILTFSDDARDETLARECGADAHLASDIDTMAERIQEYRGAVHRPMEFAASSIQGFIREQRSGERGHLASIF
jgi:hypothetical protein